MTFCKYCHKAIDDGELIMNPDENGNGYHNRCLFEKEAHDNAKRVIFIPKTATNGDMIKAIFPNLDASVSGDGDVIDVYNLGMYCQTFDEDWWNAPYKAESEG